MKKSAGFTLIELVIVIIILGILGAVAAPRLFNLQGDAYGANLNALRSSISTAATMANAKAQIQGVSETTINTNKPEDSKLVEGYRKDDGLDADIEFKFGYPIADGEKGTGNKGILGTLDGFDYNRYTIAVIEATSDEGAGISITPTSIEIADVSSEDKQKEACVVIYKQPLKAGQSAKVQAFTGGC